MAISLTFIDRGNFAIGVSFYKFSKSRCTLYARWRIRGPRTPSRSWGKS